MTFDEVLTHFPNARKNGSGYVSRCPVHEPPGESHNPSLSLKRGDDGRTLIHCHAGCLVSDILMAVGLSMRDLMPEGNGTGSDQPKRTIAATYNYVDESGTLLFQKVRYEPKSFCQRRQDGRGGWDYKLGDTRRVLYRLPGLIAADPSQWVFVVEGEKDADNLATIGIVATCNPEGAAKPGQRPKWRQEYTDTLAGRRVCIIADKDEAGRAHAPAVAESMKGKAAEVVTIELPGDGVKDASDWLDEHDSHEPEALAGRLIGMAEEAKNAFLQPIGNDPCRNESCTPPFTPVPASALGDGAAVEWDWDGYAARGHTTLLTGLWKAGKTTLLSHYIRDHAAGGHLGGAIQPGRLLVISEESAGLWARRRDDLGIGDHAEFIIKPFRGRATLDQWTAFLFHLGGLARERPYTAIVFDTLPAMWPVLKENDASEVMTALMPLGVITGSGTSVLLIHHPRKGDATEGQAARGSGALAGFVDIIVELRRFRPEDPDDRRRVLTAYSRFDETPHEQVIELTASGYRSCGTKADTQRNGRMDAIADALPTDGSGATAEELLQVWPDEASRPSSRTLRNDLKAGAKGNKWTESGTGKKGDPFRYHGGNGIRSLQGATPIGCRNESEGLSVGPSTQQEAGNWFDR